MQTIVPKIIIIKHYYSYFVKAAMLSTQTSYAKHRAMILFCSLEILGQTDSDVKTQLTDTALLWGHQKESEAADQQMINFKKLIVALYIQNSQKYTETLCSDFMFTSLGILGNIV